MVYALFFTILILGAIVTKYRSGNLIYLTIIMFLLLGIIGLRDTSVGTDTLGYTQDFIRFSYLSFSEMIATASTSKEPLYVFVSWLPSILTTNYTVFLLTWALFPVCSLYNVFKEKLQDKIVRII